MASKRATGRTLVVLKGGPFDGQSTMLGAGNTLTFATATHCGMYVNERGVAKWINVPRFAQNAGTGFVALDAPKDGMFKEPTL